MSFPKCYTVGWGIYDTAVYSLRYGVYCFFGLYDKNVLKILVTI